MSLIFCLQFASPLSAQFYDWRDAENGISIYTNGYIDQPYVVVLEDRSWLCVFTTGAGIEGSGGQHIVSSLSKDQGKTWSEPVRIEEPSEESASWAMPYLTSFGRVYVFYDYNGDKIHSLGDKKNIREDMIGWYCFKYSDDNGKTWSKRYRLPVRITDVDKRNDWKGKVQILWGIGKPIDLDKGMMFAFSKIGIYMLEDSEGWFFRCKNINEEKNPDKLVWENLPKGDQGLKNVNLGAVNAEQNILQLSDGNVYCMH
ncbi:MAG: exo-alpha-sialidase, partial [Candidatus Heimdallarchaeota archaeon]|nr:exo-alpha-sialidase [Candidatus Heimdallarchaeota archaeon]